LLLYIDIFLNQIIYEKKFNYYLVKIRLLQLLYPILFSMALKVEIAGFGLCQTVNPYSVFVICVQQERFEAWTVYRMYDKFLLLREQLLTAHPGIQEVPEINSQNLSLENLEASRMSLDRWLSTLTSNTLILRLQAMYQFLCVDANMPPPYLEIHWKNSMNNIGKGSYDEMEMEDLFEKAHCDESAMGEDEGSCEEEEEEEEEDDQDDFDTETEAYSMEKSKMSYAEATMASYSHTDSSQLQQKYSKQQKANSPPSRSNNTKKTTKKHGNGPTDEDEEDRRDGLDIQSLSSVQAEFIWNKGDEEKPAAEKEGANSVKKTINLEAFKIIKVIGKGKLL
jgi:hypothetical protein